MKFFDEFKKFAIRGNVIDLAIGIMIGSAFNGIVNSLVEDIITPPIGVATGGLSLSDYRLVLTPSILDGSGKILREAVTLNYGHFLQVFLNFLIIAFTMCIVVKMMNKLREKQQRKEEKAQAVISREEQLLTEIRDALIAKK